LPVPGPRLGRRPPFSVALVGLLVVMTALTALAIGGLAWRDKRAMSRTLVETAMTQTARLTAAQAARFLKDAESAARLGPQLVREAQLDPDSATALTRFVVASLRSHPDLSWVSYGDRHDRFVGAWRDSAGNVYVNRSFPRGGRIHLEEDRLLPGGGTSPVRRSDDHGYRPRERPYFRIAQARRDVAWTEPYEFYAGGGLGITCAAPVFDGDGGILGVFTVDFSLDRLGAFLESIEVSPRGGVLVATSQGGLVLGRPRRFPGEARRSIEADLVKRITAQLDLDGESNFELEHGGERYIGRAVPLTVGNLRWVVQVIVPERDYTEPIDAQTSRTTLLSLAALGMAIGLGVLTARWIARPLRDLAHQARRIRRGDLQVVVTPRSRDEIGVLARAMGDMTRALRDRDLIRDSLGRYVSPEIAERILRDPSALHLGGQVRHVAVLMSDLREFSALSERIGPEALIELVNRYLARMTPVILAHGGAIIDFIGDAILVLFGAPFERPDDVKRSTLCALSMQRTMDALNLENRALGLPELAMGIGLDAGTVVAGNIGSPDRMKYSVVGPAVNLASRIQSVADGGQVLATEAVAERIRGSIRLDGPRRTSVKGFAKPVLVYQVLGVVAQGDGETEQLHPLPPPDEGQWLPGPDSDPDRERPLRRGLSPPEQRFDA
jgi:adenylate cyclase